MPLVECRTGMWPANIRTLQWQCTEMLHANVILYLVYSRRYLVGDIEGGNRKCDGNDYHGI